MNNDVITLSSKVADGIGLALDQDFNRVEQPERMAWILLLLRALPDNSEWFPEGKWETIRSISDQLTQAVDTEKKWILRSRDESSA